MAEGFFKHLVDARENHDHKGFRFQMCFQRNWKCDALHIPKVLEVAPLGIPDAKMGGRWLKVFVWRRTKALPKEELDGENLSWKSPNYTSFGIGIFAFSGLDTAQKPTLAKFGARGAKRRKEAKKRLNFLTHNFSILTPPEEIFFKRYCYLLPLFCPFENATTASTKKRQGLCTVCTRKKQFQK